MSIYLWCTILGAVGLAAMAATGLGRHGHGAVSGHGHGSASGHGHGSLHGAMHLPGGVHGLASRAAGWTLMSPRLLFAGLLGFGTIGIALGSFIAGPVLLVIAIAGAIAFERLVFAPLWNFALRFASNPAVTLDAAITSDATAVTNFDANGQGIVMVEVDGQVQQILATLVPAERASGISVRAGQRVRIEDVDSARHRCSVSRL